MPLDPPDGTLRHFADIAGLEMLQPLKEQLSACTCHRVEQNRM
jgi:hypothetical protein